MAIGLLLVAAGLAAFARAPVAGSFLADVLPAMILIGLGMGMSFNPILLTAMSEVAPSEAGLASGVVNTSFMMGGAVGWPAWLTATPAHGWPPASTCLPLSPADSTLPSWQRRCWPPRPQQWASSCFHPANGYQDPLRKSRPPSAWFISGEAAGNQVDPGLPDRIKGRAGRSLYNATSQSDVRSHAPAVARLRLFTACRFPQNNRQQLYGAADD